MGRPKYLDEAIQSVLFQEFQDFELIISNNGADPNLTAIVNKYISDNRIKYIEHPEIKNMPSHWEEITQDFLGSYLMILTDRSLLKVESLNYLYKQIVEQEEKPEVISWAWDIYFDDLKVLSPFTSSKNSTKILKSGSTLLRIAKGGNSLAFDLPRGLNSCVSKELVNKMRKKYGAIFRPLSPDLTFSYLCLLNIENYSYVNKSLFVSQGLKISNGGKALAGDSTNYFKSLGIEEPFKYVPIKNMLFQSAISEDFLTMAYLCSRNDLISEWDRQKYFIDCFAEIDEKKVAGFLNIAYTQKLEDMALQALANESASLQEKVKKSITFTRQIRLRLVYIFKNLLNSNLIASRTVLMLRKRKSVYCDTALKAAGFDLQKDK